MFYVGGSKQRAKSDLIYLSFVHLTIHPYICTAHQLYQSIHLSHVYHLIFTEVRQHSGHGSHIYQGGFVKDR